MNKSRPVGVICAVLLGALALALPASSFADANVGASPAAAAPGLPDGRVNEQVTPHNKFGNQAGVIVASPGGITEPAVVFTGADGNEVFYGDTGPIGETPEGYDLFSVSRHAGSSWLTHAAFPRPLSVQGFFFSGPEFLGVSTDNRRAIFTSTGRYDPAQPVWGTPDPRVYMYDEDGTLTWLGRPTIPNPQFFPQAALIGGSPSLDTVYFSYPGTLATQDLERNPALGNISRDEQVRASGGNGGVYEWHDGTLSNAAVLPDGHLDPYGADVIGGILPGSGGGVQFTAGVAGNAVADEGKRLFFESPSPESGSGRPPELYVRTSDGATHHSVLVSRDDLLPEVAGEPASAPTGALTGMYASPDGSRVFFRSTDRLVAAAPNNAIEKQYRFDLDTESLEYIPTLLSQVASSEDGSKVLAIDEKGELDLWSQGNVTPIAALQNGLLNYPEGTKDGGVFVFESKSAIPGFNNGSGGIAEAYRYDVASNSLDCVSCPPAGVQPHGNVSLAHTSGNTSVWLFGFVSTDRNLSADGSRVFFDTPEALVPQDTNGLTDVYEWENGVVYLLSSGTSTHPSFYGDASESGNDVYFSSLAPLTSEDLDESYDVYDSRVPRPGDTPPATAVPCQGEVCQGPPSVPSLLGSPASATFTGLGNIQPTKPKATVRKKAKPKKKVKAKKKKAAKRTGKKARAGKTKKSAHGAGKSDRRAG